MSLAGGGPKPKNLPKPLPAKPPKRKTLNVKSGTVTFTVEVESNG